MRCCKGLTDSTRISRSPTAYLLFAPTSFSAIVGHDSEVTLLIAPEYNIFAHNRSSVMQDALEIEGDDG